MKKVIDLTPDMFYPNQHTQAISRRGFLKGSTGLSVGLVIALQLPFAKRASALNTAEPVFSPNAFVRIAPDNTVTILVKHIEIGQGAFTGLATLAAEELDADWSQMRAEHAPANTTLYKNFAFGIQGVGGSTGLANSYEQVRKAGASARAMLVAAAAQKWHVQPNQINVAQGQLTNTLDNRTASFGEIATLAAQQQVPQDVTLKSSDQFTLIGTHLPKLDTAAKSSGKAVYTQDIQLDNTLYAMVAHPPKFGALLAEFDAEKARSMPGVVMIKQIPQGVAVVAKSTYQAMQAREALVVKWNEEDTENRSSEQLFRDFKQAASKPGLIAHENGNVEQALAQSTINKDLTFEFPYLAHAPMETLDAVIRANKDGTVDVWMGSQLQTVDQATIAGVFSVPPDKVNLMTQLGGGTFGRRAQPDSGFAAEAAQVAQLVDKGIPVKLMWTRKDDIQGGRYRPLTVHRVKAGLNDEGDITAWQQMVATQSIVKGSPFEQMIQNGIDPTSIEGAHNIAYELKDRQVSLHTMTSQVPVLWWRSVGHTHTAYVLEVMLDYMLQLANKDPIQGRLSLLGKSPREAGVLKAVADMAEKSGPAPKGSARGVAVHQSFGTYVAQIAEVTRGSNDMPKVTKVWCAIDCGIAVNPNIIQAQLEGGIGFGLSAILYEELVLEEGGTLPQDNFDGYRTLRMPDMPTIETQIIANTESPTGVGEPGTPPIGPAVSNAWRRLTGQMVTRLPFSVGVKQAISI